jgi:hypothetical protein
MPVRGRPLLGWKGSRTIHLRADPAKWHISETIRDRLADPFAAGRMAQAIIVGKQRHAAAARADRRCEYHHRLVPVIATEDDKDRRLRQLDHRRKRFEPALMKAYGFRQAYALHEIGGHRRKAAVDIKRPQCPVELGAIQCELRVRPPLKVPASTTPAPLPLFSKRKCSRSYR